MDRERDLRHMRGTDPFADTDAMNNTSSPTRPLVREIVFAAALMAAVFSPGAILALAQSSVPADAGAARGAGPGPQMPDLVGALKATPGVLGVDAGRMISGKQVIFAWFENKQAVLTWYYSPVHQAMMRTFAAAGPSSRTPLAGVTDPTIPILAIASLTMNEQPQVEGVTLPVSQIAIELYAPVPGGLASGGRFAPAAVKVPGLLER